MTKYDVLEKNPATGLYEKIDSVYAYDSAEAEMMAFNMWSGKIDFMKCMVKVVRSK